MKTSGRTTRAFVRGMFAPGADESLVERVVADMSAAPQMLRSRRRNPSGISGPS